MNKRKPTLSDLWQAYINQPIPPSEFTMKYVAALKARIDSLELENALLNRDLKSFSDKGVPQ